MNRRDVKCNQGPRYNEIPGTPNICIKLSLHVASLVKWIVRLANMQEDWVQFPSKAENLRLTKSGACHQNSVEPVWTVTGGPRTQLYRVVVAVDGPLSKFQSQRSHTEPEPIRATVR